MEYNVSHFLILGSLILGAGYSSFKIGVRQGAEAMFDHLWKAGDRNEHDSNSVTVVLKK